MVLSVFPILPSTVCNFGHCINFGLGTVRVKSLLFCPAYKKTKLARRYIPHPVNDAAAAADVLCLIGDL